jgi:uncharacterized protein with GYD domain
MIRLVTRGRFTRDYAKGLIAAPEDREPIVRKLVEGAGGKLVNFYFTTGDADFPLITETAAKPCVLVPKSRVVSLSPTFADRDLTLWRL